MNGKVIPRKFHVCVRVCDCCFVKPEFFVVVRCSVVAQVKSGYETYYVCALFRGCEGIIIGRHHPTYRLP